MVRFHNILAFLVLSLSLNVSSAALPAEDYSPSEPVLQHKSTCKHPLKRKEWRMLNKREKKDYIDAVLCLQKLPSKSDPAVLPGAKTRWDDFNGVHITKSRGLFERTGGIHIVGQFLPWHRYFLIIVEKALREECGYKGAQPYWNWTLDSKPGMDIHDSPVFDPVTGFGGDGKPGVPLPPPAATRIQIPGGTGGGCVMNGPFVNLTVNIGPGDSVTYNPRCLTRSINPTMSGYLTYSNIAPLTKANTFKEFDLITEATPYSLNESVAITFHIAGHLAVGGDQEDAFSSNCDPLWYLHHTFIDSLWLAWQKADPTGSRFFDISGPQKPFSSWPLVTLDYPIDLGVSGVGVDLPPIPILKVMDVTEGNKGGIGCYEYE